MPHDRLAYSVKETAGLLGSSVDFVRKAVNKGEIRSVRLMGKILIPAVEIDRILGNDTRSSPTPQQMVEAFAKLVGIDEDKP